MDWISRPDAWIAFATLTVLELVLGIDNIVFISILSEKVKEERQRLARTVGLAIAMLSRVALLFSISWVMSLTEPLFTLLGREFAGRDLILVFGGLFLLGKATREIHEKLEGEEHGRSASGTATFTSVIVQIALLDLVFSLDSVITAVGMADDLGVMVSAVIVAVLFMMVAAEPVSSFVSRHPTVKMLALSFLLLIGMTLVAEGLGQHISKGYIYFAMGFSVFVEMLNLRAKGTSAPVDLRGPRMPPEGPAPAEG
ncbi:TerC family protein [Gaopeijia maritima]|uniref:TerC family protein n=1 Tax=Gaopeijia maritima TaxID=3119007 RepID=UPI00327880F6